MRRAPAPWLALFFEGSQKSYSVDSAHMTRKLTREKKDLVFLRQLGQCAYCLAYLDDAFQWTNAALMTDGSTWWRLATPRACTTIRTLSDNTCPPGTTNTSYCGVVPPTKPKYPHHSVASGDTCWGIAEYRCNNGNNWESVLEGASGETFCSDLKAPYAD